MTDSSATKKHNDKQGNLFETNPDTPEQDAPTTAQPTTEQPAPARGKKAKAQTTVNAETMAKRQREISVSEFFTKNRHLLGFDSPRKALLTAVKEAIDNSLDACEEARIVPDIRVEIRKVKDKENIYTMIVEDNGPGIVRAQVPNVFGRLLYGSKFHRLRQSRGQQGIGISAAGMYGQLTTGNAVRVKSRTSSRAQALEFEVRIDSAKNKPESKDKPIEWDKKHGTEVAIDLEGEYRRGQRSVEEFLKLCAVANPHVQFTFVDPDGNQVVYDRATKELPKEVEEIKPHPHGVELGILLKMIAESENRTTSAFLQGDFSRVGPKVAKEICAKAKVKPETNPRRLSTEDVTRLKKSIDSTKIMAPPLSCIAPIGEELILKGLKKEVEAEFYIASSRSPVVYRGRPFAVEVGLAYGKPGEKLEMTEGGKIIQVVTKQQNQEALMGGADDPVKLIRFANRVPLLFQQAACAITKSVIATNWKNYGLQQPRGALPIGPMVIFVHIASVWVPFTSESKEAIAPGIPEIQAELRLALQDCGRKLGTHVRKGKKLAGEFKKRNYIETYIPHVVEALKEILDLDEKKVDKATADLTSVLERSRKL